MSVLSTAPCLLGDRDVHSLWITPNQLADLGQRGTPSVRESWLAHVTEPLVARHTLALEVSGSRTLAGLTLASCAVMLVVLVRRLPGWWETRANQRRVVALFGAGAASEFAAKPPGARWRRIPTALNASSSSPLMLSRAAGMRVMSGMRGSSKSRQPHPYRWFALAAGCLVAVLLEGAVGVAAGICTAFVVWRWADHQGSEGDSESASERRRAAAQLPLTADLLAACMAAGSRPTDAARAVGACLGGPLGERLVRSCEELKLGAEPAAAWSRVAELPGGAPLARCLVRAQLSGAPAVEQMTRQAVDSRAASSRSATARARKASVLVTGPLGLCFLPAFLLAGVAPVIVGLGRTLL